jgi:hypothetical protein
VCCFIRQHALDALSIPGPFAAVHASATRPGCVGQKESQSRRNIRHFQAIMIRVAVIDEVPKEHRILQIASFCTIEQHSLDILRKYLFQPRHAN